MPYNLCLFDLDGMLTDSKVGITKSFQYALSAFGIHEELENLTKFIGPPLRESFKGFYGFSNNETDIAIAKYREYYAETGLYENTVYPGIPDLLQKLKDRDKILAVATSKAKPFADKILAYFNIDGFFSYVAGDEMDGSLTRGGKHDIIQKAINALDCTREMSPVMIGDRMYDIVGAQKVGIDSIGVLWGYGTRDELEEARATWIVESTDELYELIVGGRP